MNVVPLKLAVVAPISVTTFSNTTGVPVSGLCSDVFDADNIARAVTKNIKQASQCFLCWQLFLKRLFLLFVCARRGWARGALAPNWNWKSMTSCALFLQNYLKLLLSFSAQALHNLKICLKRKNNAKVLVCSFDNNVLTVEICLRGNLDRSWPTLVWSSKMTRCWLVMIWPWLSIACCSVLLTWRSAWMTSRSSSCKIIYVFCFSLESTTLIKVTSSKFGIGKISEHLFTMFTVAAS